MKKYNLSKNLLSLVFLNVVALFCVHSQHINVLFNDAGILDAQNIVEEEKAISMLLQENSTKNIEEIHILVDCQDQLIYLDDIIDMKGVIKQADQDQRDVWILVETLQQQGKPVQKCIDQILMDAIDNNYQLYDSKTFSRRQKFDANTNEKQNAYREKFFTIFSFISSRLDESKYSSTSSNGNKYFDIKDIQVLQQGSTEIVLILALGILALLGFGVFIFLKKRKNKNSGNNVQRNFERQKFIPRLQGSFDSRLDQSKSFSEGVLSQKRTLPAINTEDVNQVLPKLFTPNFKGASLKLDDKMPVINDNMFNHIETPRSVEDLGSQKEVKDTPQGVDFNIEFSIVESDPKGSVTRG